LDLPHSSNAVNHGQCIEKYHEIDLVLRFVQCRFASKAMIATHLGLLNHAARTIRPPHASGRRGGSRATMDDRAEKMCWGVTLRALSGFVAILGFTYMLGLL
jgi:hypothetical protein